MRIPVVEAQKSRRLGYPPMSMTRLLVMLFASMVATLADGMSAKDISQARLPLPDALSPAVDFWTRIFTEVDSANGFVHDSHRLNVVYQTLYLNPDAPSQAQDRTIRKALGEYRRSLLMLASGKREALSSVEKRIRQAWGQQTSPEEFKQAAERVRFQRGQSDRILEGLTRYDRWKGKIQAILRNQGLPTELAALPLVESSYNPRAVSKAGAVGLWQFMPATARRYLRVGGQIDERLDPMKSSEAAALLLKQNFSVLKSWPLAITAYNHGLSGVRRAVRETGTDDLGEIAKNYETERFGFASRNFYAAFLAAVEVTKHPSQYFRAYQQDKRYRIAVVTPAYLPVDVLVEGLDIDKDRLRSLNPSLHHAVWNGKQFVPEGYVLNLPATFTPSSAEERLATLAESFGFSAQRPSPYYEVHSGDSLSEIAERHDTTAAKLLALNRIRSADEIHAGQILRVPLMPEPKPLGLGSAALLAAQRANGEIDSDAVDFAGLIGALARQDIHIDSDVRGPSREEGRGSEACQTGAPEEAGPSPVYMTENDAATAALLTNVQPDLAADPADYGVFPDGTIEIQIGETLGHYADWLRIDSDRIRMLNELQGNTPLIVGRGLKLEFSAVSTALFEEQRVSFHKARQLEYFRRHRIKGVIEHPIIAGDNLWLLAVEQYGIPFWLLRQFNPDLNIDTILTVGSVMVVPFVETLPDESTCAVVQVSATTEDKDRSR